MESIDNKQFSQLDEYRELQKKKYEKIKDMNNAKELAKIESEPIKIKPQKPLTTAELNLPLPPQPKIQQNNYGNYINNEACSIDWQIDTMYDQIKAYENMILSYKRQINENPDFINGKINECEVNIRGLKRRIHIILNG